MARDSSSAPTSENCPPAGSRHATQAPTAKSNRAPIIFDTKGDAQTWLAMQSAAITESRWKPAPPPEPEPAHLRCTTSTGGLSARELKPKSPVRVPQARAQRLTPSSNTFTLDQITPELIKAWSWDETYGTTPEYP